MLPSFDHAGYLPEGLHQATESEVTFRFGSSSARRRRLTLRLRRWIALAREVGARRLLVDGSFVTSKADPEDVDAVMLLPINFQDLIVESQDAALELEQILLTRQPEELFAAEDDGDWNAWVQFFSRTREVDGRRKGLVEVEL
jgi:hypothetical protein